MTDLISVLTYTAALLLAVIVALALYAWREVQRNDDLTATLDQLRHDLADAEKSRADALYRAGRLERRLARLERDDEIRSRRAGYIDMPPMVNGKRVR